jgi:predicted deacylase
LAKGASIEQGKAGGVGYCTVVCDWNPAARPQHAGIRGAGRYPGTDARVYERSKWIRVSAGNGGFFFPTAKPDDMVQPGDSLGKIVDPLTDESFHVMFSISGEIIGMVVSQPVLSGFALYHLAWKN